MTPRAEELWSYLIGLGPVGERVPVRRGDIAEDLKVFGSHISMLVAELLSARVIRRVDAGLVVVLKRIGPCRDERQFAGPRRATAGRGG